MTNFSKEARELLSAVTCSWECTNSLDEVKIAVALSLAAAIARRDALREAADIAWPQAHPLPTSEFGQGKDEAARLIRRRADAAQAAIERIEKKE